jgi:GT2 family glycosyltransferase
VAARGDILLFLWPDAQLPANALHRIEQNFKLLPQSVGGNFHMKFDDTSLFTRLFTRFLKRWRYRGRYYGNSGIFVRREAFEAIGGFKSYPILEDYDFARRMEKCGPTLYLPDKILASTRRFKRQKLKAAVLWSLTQMLFIFGIRPKTLARMCLEL